MSSKRSIVSKCDRFSLCSFLISLRRGSSGPRARGQTEVQAEVGHRKQPVPRPDAPPSHQEAPWVLLHHLSIVSLLRGPPSARPAPRYKLRQSGGTWEDSRGVAGQKSRPDKVPVAAELEVSELRILEQNVEEIEIELRRSEPKQPGWIQMVR